MNYDDKKLKAHMFVCISCTPPSHELGPTSAESLSTAKELRQNLKLMAKEKYTKSEVKVSAVHCLGRCEEGIACVLYPSGHWMTKAGLSDRDDLFKALENEVSRNK
jgi:predicted metal-binding protein